MSSHFSEILAFENHLKDNNLKYVSKKDYEKFCHEFIFDKLKGISFGEAFCKKFEFNSVYLKNLSDNTAKNHIEQLGYIK